MEHKENFESLGFVIKKEKLANLASDYKFSELILEELDPYPGFYDHFHIPMNEKEQRPRSIFALLKSMSLEDMDDFIRITMKIKKDFPFRFDAVIAKLELQNNQYPCIRIYMDNYTALSDLILLYSKNGIGFLPNKVVKPHNSLINVRKYFSLKAIGQNIYKDEDLADTYYFPVEKYLPWPKFESVTIAIRNNWDHKVYDAAQAGIYCKTGIAELVRIYDRKATVEHLAYLKDRYNIEAARSI